MTAAVAASDTTYKIVQNNLQQKLVKYLYFEKKRLEHKMGLSYDQIYNQDNTIRNFVKSVTNEDAPRKFGYRITPNHKNTIVNYRS